MIRLFSFLILCLMATASFAADVSTHSLASDASGQFYWIARNVHQPSGSDGADIFNRAFSQDDNWIYVTHFPSRVDVLAAHDSAAGAVTSDGSWIVLYDSQTIIPGGALPAATKMLALAAGGRDWWAVGDVPGGMEAVRIALERARATSKPATRPTTSSASQPTTGPAASLPHELVLFKLEGNDWNAVATLDAAPGSISHVSIAVVDNTPYVAMFDGATISVQRRDRGAWVALLRVADKTIPASFKLFPDGSVVRLWVQREQGPDLLYRLDGGKTKPLSLAGLPDIPARDRTAALFGQSFRIIGETTKGLFEQRFALDTGEPQGKPSTIRLSGVAPMMTLQEIHSAILLTSMLLVGVGWVRVQSAEEDAPEPKPLPIAPLGRRLAAGVIDLSPVIFTLLFFYLRYHTLQAGAEYKDFMLLLAYWASGLFYVLLTTLSEVIGGRSLGKIIVGLKVVTRHGETPTALALLTRNLLRMFDLSLFFLPVVAIIFSPARQRAGDLAAGTVVIYDEAEDAKDSKGD